MISRSTIAKLSPLPYRLCPPSVSTSFSKLPTCILAFVGFQSSVSIDLLSSTGEFAPVTFLILNAGLPLSLCGLENSRLLDALISASNTETTTNTTHQALVSPGLITQNKKNNKLLFVGSDWSTSALASQF